MRISIPARLAVNCRRSAGRTAWLDRLPDTVRDLEDQWSLTLGTPFDSEDVSCAWVAPAKLANGSSAVLKVPMPQMEAEHELAGLRFWNGNPTVRVLLADDHTGAMLLALRTRNAVARTTGVQSGRGDCRASSPALALAIGTAPVSAAIGFDELLD
jgi:streptomycin 6-kinase